MEETKERMTLADLDAFVFSKSVPLQVALQEVLKSAGDLDGKSCLAIGSVNAMLSYQLRRSGGQWQELVFDEVMAQNLQEVVGEEAHVYEGDSLPFRAKVFDLVVILSGLSEQRSDSSFVEMCHKVLKPDGRLLVCVPREKALTILNPLRSLIGLPTRSYTESRLFAILKNGFDVMHMRSYSRFFVELVNMCVQGLSRRQSDYLPEEKQRLHKVAYVFFWIAYQLDLLIFFTRGHRLIACAKRRGWRSREAPILVDGRSISEAVLSPIDR
jgi:SAM-dependent methyltransferase